MNIWPNMGVWNTLCIIVFIALFCVLFSLFSEENNILYNMIHANELGISLPTHRTKGEINDFEKISTNAHDRDDHGHDDGHDDPHLSHCDARQNHHDHVRDR